MQHSSVNLAILLPSPLANRGNSVVYCERIGSLGAHNLYAGLIPTLVVVGINVNSTDFSFEVVTQVAKSLQF